VTFRPFASLAYNFIALKLLHSVFKNRPEPFFFFRRVRTDSTPRFLAVGGGLERQENAPPTDWSKTPLFASIVSKDLLSFL